MLGNSSTVCASTAENMEAVARQVSLSSRLNWYAPRSTKLQRRVVGISGRWPVDKGWCKPVPVSRPCPQCWTASIKFGMWLCSSGTHVDQSPQRMCDTGVRVPSLSCFSRSATMPGVKRNVAQINIFIPNARKNAQVVSYALSALPAKHPARYAMTKSMRRSRA